LDHSSVHVPGYQRCIIEGLLCTSAAPLKTCTALPPPVRTPARGAYSFLFLPLKGVQLVLCFAALSAIEDQILLLVDMKSQS
jgi:hypothetical protein